ncbi:hypothetical protein NP233_g10363 [Leucocoprinus birnbaumii]|uniref:Uncharacterized protein n=1 Tax=Leucocoprinus birnbaumii TaxID=56174 RepID=A0AAD5YLD7_9AGAR|nr:hypothetical protein NP233_g10363 [Leucocoprinus birnbaumii]
MTHTILLEYLDARDTFPSTNVLETLKTLCIHFSQSTDLLPHVGSDSSYQTQTSTAPHTNTLSTTPEPGTPILSPLSSSINTLIAAADTDHDLLPLSTRLNYSQSSFAFPPTIPIGETHTRDLCITALLNANDTTEIRDYAIYCEILAQMNFMHYWTVRKDASDLEEAVEYSVTAYQLLADIADMSINLIIGTTITILYEYLRTTLAQFCLPNVSVMETLAALCPPIPTLEPNTPVLSTLSDATNAWVPAADADHNLFPSPNHLNSSQPPFTFPLPIPDSETSTMESCMTVLLNANDETEIRDYAICCQVLAQFQFSRYQTAKDASDLEEAAEYSVTAYQLVADLADVSLSLILTKVITISMEYLDAYHAELSRLPSINVLETFGALIDRFSKSNDPPPYV